MADRIFQLDGAQESSSESDADGFSKSSLQGEEALRSDVSLDPGHSILEPADGGLQLSPNWSGNITSIWSENSACPTPSTVCQTPFWSNCSSKMDSWLSQSQESWTWNDEAGSRLADCLSGKAEAEISSTFTGDLQQQSFKNITPIEPHPDLFTTTCNEEGYCSSSVVTPHRDADLALGMSQPSAVHSPSKEIDTSGMNLDFICESVDHIFMSSIPVWEKRMIKADNKMNESQKIIVPKAVNKKLGDEDEKPVTMSESLPSRKVLSDNNPRLTFCLTLKQYIKDCKEIVSVDFKNLCNREMVIIEYKSYNERCVQNKFLIKPLDKFLEKWNAAEKKVNKRLSKNESRPEVVSELNICGSDERESFHSMMNVLRRKSCNTSQLNSMKNKFTVKSMEILQDNLTPGSDSMSYNVNENVVSQGKIRMKLIKSHSENFEKDLVEASKKGLVKGSGPTKMRPSFSCSNPLCSKRNKVTRLEKEDRNDRIKGLHLTDSRRQIKKSPGGLFLKESSKELQKKLKRWRRFSELDAKLIKEINTSFEEYFKNIVQLNNRSLKKKQKVRQSLRNDDETGEESTEDEKDETADIEKKWTGSSIQCGALSSTTDSIKFVRRLLSNFSRISQSMDSPPLSITISVGNAFQPAPVQVNLQPIADVSVEQTRRLGKISKRKVKIESVDGAADDSSSDDSSGCDSLRRSPNQKKKRDAFYKPLNVVLQGTPSAFKQPVKKRKSSTVGNAEIDEENYERKKSSASHDSEDYVGVYRENSRQSWVSSRKEKYSKGKNSSEILVTSQKSCGNEIKSLSNSVGSGQGCVGYPNVRPREPDFIFDSDQDGKSEVSMTKCIVGRSLTANKNSRLKKIPQEDINAGTSSDDEYLNMGYKPVLKKTLSRRKSKAAMGKRYPANQRVVSRVFVGGEYLEKETNDPFASAESAESSSATKGAKNPFKASQITECVSIPSAASHQDLPATSLTPTWQQLPCADDLNSMGSTSLRISSSGLVHADCFLSSATNDSPEPFPLSGTPLVFSEGSNSQSSKSLIDSPLKLEKFDFSKITVDFLSQTKIAGFNVGARSKEEMAVSEGTSSEWIFGSSVLIPKQKPLTRKEIVESLVLYETSGNVDQAAFYGDPGDLTKAMEIGPRVLKIEGRSLSRLKPFRSTLQVFGVDERRTQLLSVPNNKSPGNRSLLSLGREIRIIPLRKPPKHERVLGWITNRERFQGISKREPKPKVTVVNPMSPGAEEGSEEDMELSVTLSNSTEDGACVKVALEANSVKCLTNRREKVVEMDSPSKTEKSTGPHLLPTVRLNTEEPPGGPVHLLLSSDSQPSYEEDKRNSDNSFQIRGITLENTLGFSGPVENIQNVQLNHSRRHLSLLVIELHCQTRKDLCPDPEHDPIRGLFYAITPEGVTQDPKTGVIVVGKESSSEAASNKHEIHYVLTEKALFEKIILLVRTWDPDILAGYEIEMHSWGYLIQRGFVLEMNLLCLLGRVQSEDSRSWKSAPDVLPRGDDLPNENDLPKNVRNMKISGRIMLDIWRVLRHEVPLTSYTFENVMYHLSHERHSLLSYRTLSFCWEHTSGRYRHITVHHCMTRVLGVIRLLDQLDFINRTSELSRLFGIQFYEVLSRGSQFRVESMMLRLAKPMNYVAVSPSIVQRAQMRAPACLPLILEPESSFYTDPVIVLDFQSLYPSIIIAYNYCFSTCLGRVEKLGGREAFEFGCTQLQFSPEELKNLEHEISISPAGVAFVKPNIRKGVLPIMLEEILETRLMVKKAMKENKYNKVLQKVLYARQLGLKLIANVTYGYTAANFSGRMPCIEVGDSVVSKGRETLHRAIQLIKNTHKWGAKVVYGDTDSVFVLTPGRSREEAFRIGSEIADAVTHDNPKPVKLKLEKVYQPSILQTKKRYVGYMYESAQQEKPVFEAKGIETVRRDGCPATGKILEKALRILFDSKDVSMVKKYTIRQFAKLFQGRINLQDLVFAKEYKGRSGYRPGACVPALYLARQWTQKDRRAEPRVKERVPYVIVNGPPGVPLIRLVRSPHDLFADRSLHINAVYYITKAFIPPMQRCFSLLGADVSSWYSEIPRKYQKSHKTGYGEGQKRITISQYFAATECIVCSKITNSPVCPDCECHQQTLGVFCLEKIRRWERCHAALLRICQGCCGRTTELDCKSIDCPVLFRRNQAFRNLEQGSALREILAQYL